MRGSFIGLEIILKAVRTTTFWGLLCDLHLFPNKSSQQPCEIAALVQWSCLIPVTDGWVYIFLHNSQFSGFTLVTRHGPSRSIYSTEIVGNYKSGLVFSWEDGSSKFVCILLETGMITVTYTYIRRQLISNKIKWSDQSTKFKAEICFKIAQWKWAGGWVERW
jgi:hypothetical protein